MEITVNFLAVLAAALSSMFIGMAWYGPLFGKLWMSYTSWTPETRAGKKGGMTRGYVINCIASFVMAFIIAYFIKLFGVVDFSGAFILSVLFWLGFVATTGLGSVLWEEKPWGYYFVNIFYYLVSITVMASILTFWG